MSTVFVVQAQTGRGVEVSLIPRRPQAPLMYVPRQDIRNQVQRGGTRLENVSNVIPHLGGIQCHDTGKLSL